ncbi:hypothetical protein [Novosphingobium sp.]|uniref:hypothetical protein n=1 Tax=Novosphingobium sp. TaxID=1874826 RepID=UPI0028AA3E13|nr:hypothetical protein [Novosphingobium sp.]
MLRLLSAACALPLLLAASGAAAHIVGPPAPRPSSPPYGDAGQKDDEARYRLDLREVDKVIREGRETGRFSKQDAKGLRRERQQIESLAQRYGDDGMSPREAEELYMRERVLEKSGATARQGQALRSVPIPRHPEPSSG